MSEEKEQTAEEIVAEMQELMQRQMELQAKLLKTNWNGFGEALGAFMDVFKGAASVQTPEASKKEDKEKVSDES